MKILTALMIFSILFSSLPTKVWACGLNICPMEHGADIENDIDSMPCHQVQSHSDQDNSEKQIDKQNPQIAESPLACPCPNTYVSADYTLESPGKEIQSKSSSYPFYEVLNLIDQPKATAHHYSPPPPRLTSRLQILLQVFLI